MKPPRFSPSQFKTADHDAGGCETKWFLEKIEGHAPPSSRSQALGTAVHAALEAWQRDGTPLPDDAAGRIAAPALELLPPRDLVALIEEERTFILPRSGAAVLCRIDFAIRGPAGVLAPWDFKTTSSPRYAKGPDELATDLQMACYAHALAPGVDTRVSHVYMVTRGAPRAWVAAARSEVAARAGVIDHLDTLAERLIELREDGRRSSARKHAEGSEACNAYGGCPHRSICFSAHKEGITMSSMLEKIRAAQAARNGAPPVAPPSPATAPPPVAPPALTPREAEYESSRLEGVDVVAPQPVTPPDAPAPAPSAPFVKEAPAPIEASAPAPLVLDAAPKRRGRPPGSKNKASLAPAAVESLEASLPDAAPPAAEPVFPYAAGAGFRLLVDCVPTRGDPRDPARPLAGYLAAVALDVAAAAEVADWHEIAYGKGAGLIAAAIRASPPTEGTWYVDSSGPTAKIALEVLEALATTVIRGLR